MPRPALLLHELFPTFPALWKLLFAGAVLGVVITLLARRSKKAGRTILGVPWIVPGYTLLAVVAAGLLSFVFPPAELLLVPGIVVLFAVDVPDVLVPVVIGGVSWMVWTICATIVWGITKAASSGLRRGPRPDAGRSR